MSHHHSVVATAITVSTSYRLLQRPLLHRLLHWLLHLLLQRPAVDLNDVVGVRPTVADDG
jgi:hypothetical protein